MLRKLTVAGLIWPTLLALMGLGVLVGLGTWQLERLAWKSDLLSRIAARTKAEPVPLARALQLWRETGDIEYVHVRAAGRFAHAQERYVYAVDEKLGPGFNVFTPLLANGNQLLLVNRGFVPEALREPSKRPEGQVAGTIEVTGLARRPMPPGWFTPASDPVRNLYFWPDYPNLLAPVLTGVALERGQEGLSPVPFFVDADAQPGNPGGFPRGGTTRLALPNRHLEYAITWYGLALSLIAVYFAYARTRLRALEFVA
jgi:surfeit locus 1 family protein